MASRPARNRQASSRVADGANGEAPGAVHQSVLAAKPILDLIKKIGKLSALLPETVPEAPADDDIHRIITRVEHPDGTVAATFRGDYVKHLPVGCSEGERSLPLPLCHPKHTKTNASEKV
ncbi:hypothetical protein DFH08DRAFT_804652 [Mycena albidolilacea]|uniref:Uncharacterized protein n=1 Tax=Mycena albidolilacea TaxID=1033008 RepID=A0AAD7EV66_9AGAR|nr:hypothetical protein DFH08DRAFT_804652 [Mycena albidolilacea]